MGPNFSDMFAIMSEIKEAKNLSELASNYGVIWHTTGNFAKVYQNKMEQLKTQKKLVEELYEELYHEHLNYADIEAKYAKPMTIVKENTAQVSFSNDSQHR